MCSSEREMGTMRDDSSSRRELLLYEGLSSMGRRSHMQLRPISDETMSMHTSRSSDSRQTMRVWISVGAHRYSLHTARSKPESTRIIYISDMEESYVVSLCSRSQLTISKVDTHVGCIVSQERHCFTFSRMDSIRRRLSDSSSTESSVVIPVSSVTVRSVMDSWNKYEQ